MGGFKEWADGWVRVRGGYGFRSLLKQKIKGKILLRHLHRRIFFSKKNFCYEVFAKQKKTERPDNNYWRGLSLDLRHQCLALTLVRIECYTLV